MTDFDRIRKVAAFLPVSRELLADAEATAAMIRAGATQTPAEAAAERARLTEERASRHQLAQERHTRVAARLSGILLGVFNLHQPMLEDWAIDPVCRGCEYQGYDAEPATWPCTTWVVIKEDVEEGT